LKKIFINTVKAPEIVNKKLKKQVPAIPINNKGRLPTLSTKNIDIKVIKSITIEINNVP
jgi:hypothetical protein